MSELTPGSPHNARYDTSERMNCPDGPDCDPSYELVDPGDPWTTHLVCLVHDNDRTTP